MLDTLEAESERRSVLESSGLHFAILSLIPSLDGLDRLSCQGGALVLPKRISNRARLFEVRERGGAQGGAQRPIATPPRSEPMADLELLMRIGVD